MNSLDHNFNTFVSRMKRGRNFDDAAFEPIYYLVFPPSQMLESE